MRTVGKALLRLHSNLHFMHLHGCQDEINAAFAEGGCCCTFCLGVVRDTAPTPCEWVEGEMTRPREEGQLWKVAIYPEKRSRTFAFSVRSTYVTSVLLTQRNLFYSESDGPEKHIHKWSTTCMKVKESCHVPQFVLAERITYT